MHWSDEALVLGARRHGESAVVLELMTRAHGRHLGLVHGARSKRLSPVLQPGNTVQALWRARLDEHLGVFTVEAGEMRSARLIGSPLALYGVGAMAALLRLVPERDPHPALYDVAAVLADHLADPQVAPALFVRFELALLAELGFGLDLSECAATGARENLAFVSPKSGRAVSGEAGKPYGDRLFALPSFLQGAFAEEPPRGELRAGFALTEHFLRTRLFEPRGLAVPEERARFVALSTRNGPVAPK
jgi:DNA repair protein RecO (recombination protein O)